MGTITASQRDQHIRELRLGGETLAAIGSHFGLTRERIRQIAGDIRPDRAILRFERMVTPEPNSGCSLWLGTCGRKGYGVFSLNGRTISAHRAAWLLTYGEIPHGLNVLHRCDNPPCVEIRHLFLGTIADNSKDMALKNRGAKSRRGLPYGARKSGRRFLARVKIDGVNISLGTYSSADDASAVAMSYKRSRLRPSSK